MIAPVWAVSAGMVSSSLLPLLGAMGLLAMLVLPILLLIVPYALLEWLLVPGVVGGGPWWERALRRAVYELVLFMAALLLVVMLTLLASHGYGARDTGLMMGVVLGFWAAVVVPAHLLGLMIRLAQPWLWWTCHLPPPAWAWNPFASTSGPARRSLPGSGAWSASSWRADPSGAPPQMAGATPGPNQEEAASAAGLDELRPPEAFGQRLARHATAAAGTALVTGLVVMLLPEAVRWPILGWSVAWLAADAVLLSWWLRGTTTAAVIGRWILIQLPVAAATGVIQMVVSMLTHPPEVAYGMMALIMSPISGLIWWLICIAPAKVIAGGVRMLVPQLGWTWELGLGAPWRRRQRQPRLRRTVDAQDAVRWVDMAPGGRSEPADQRAAAAPPPPQPSPAPAATPPLTVHDIDLG